METVISQNTDEKLIFRLFKIDVKADFFTLATKEQFLLKRNTI